MRPPRIGSVLGILLLLGSPASVLEGAPQPTGEAAAPSDEPERVECPRCGGKGKTDCSECGGRGEIYRVCEICKGSGKKPCPVCTKPDPAGGAATPAGTVRCGYCGGRGTTGQLGRPCPKCQGTAVLTCPTCIGSGTVSCRKEVFVRVCPRCRFTGKETCSLCGGTGNVAPSVATSQGSAGPEEGRPPEPASADAPPKDRAEASTPTSDPSEGPSFAEIKARYDALVPQCEMHYDVFAEDLTPKADTVRAQAREWIRKLQLGGAQDDSQSLHELEKIVERAESFRKRWQGLRGLLQEEHRSYANAKRTLELRDEAVAGAKGSARSRLEDHWDDRFDLVVRILEKNVAPLLEDDPTWLPREIAALETAWDALRVTVEQEAKALAELRAKPEDTAGSDEKESTAGTPAEGEAVPTSPTDGGGEGTSRTGVLGAPNLARKEGDARNPNPRRAVVESTDPVSDAIARAPHSGDGEVPRPATAPRSEDSGFFWAVVGFLAATALFAAGSLLRRRQPVED